MHVSSVVEGNKGLLYRICFILNITLSLYYLYCIKRNRLFIIAVVPEIVASIPFPHSLFVDSIPILTFGLS